jgi:DNA-binding CsgD family transcriptional regulator
VEAALRTSHETGDDTRAHLTRQWRCDLLAALDLLEESLQLSTENVAAAQRDRQGWALHTFETGRARQLFQLGRLTDAAAILEDRFSADTAHQIVSVLDAAGVVALGRVAMHLGEQGQSRRTAQIAQVMVDRGAPSIRRHGEWLLALQAMADGDPVRAHQSLCASGVDERLSIVPLFPMDVADEVRLVDIAIRVGDGELAEHAAAAVQERARRNPDVPSIAAAAAHTNGVLNHSLDDLAKAVQLFALGRRPLALAAAIEDLGVLTVDSGDTDQAVDAFSRALVIFTECGAAWDAGRLRGRLRALGVRRRLITVQRPGHGWAAMTDSELTVARLVAQGMTNREVAERLFVSRHTVSGHLRSVFAKLSVNSRVELTRLAGVSDPAP